MTTVRSKLLSQKAEQKKFISQWNYQLLPCVEMALAPVHECPCLPAPGCKILKSVHPLPEVMTDKNKHLINYVTNLNGDIVYDYMTWKEKKHKKGNKYTGGDPDYWIRNGYLYSTYRTGPKILVMEILAEDPLVAEAFPSFCPGVEDTSCSSPLDKDFPIDTDLIDTLVELCVQELIGIFKQNTEDLTNTTTDTHANAANNQESK
jgi:hypothetical protein